MSELIQEHVRDEIWEQDRKFMALYKQGDCAGVAALYSEDPVLMPPNMGILRGKEAIQKTFEAFRAMGILELVFEIVEVEQTGDRAVEMSTYKLVGPGDLILDEGKYIVVWKHEHDEWKLHRDIFNTSLPPK